MSDDEAEYIIGGDMVVHNSEMLDALLAVTPRQAKAGPAVNATVKANAPPRSDQKSNKFSRLPPVVEEASFSDTASVTSAAPSIRSVRSTKTTASNASTRSKRSDVSSTPGAGSYNPSTSLTHKKAVGCSFGSEDRMKHLAAKRNVVGTLDSLVHCNDDGASPKHRAPRKPTQARPLTSKEILDRYAMSHIESEKSEFGKEGPKVVALCNMVDELLNVGATFSELADGLEAEVLDNTPVDDYIPEELRPGTSSQRAIIQERMKNPHASRMKGASPRSEASAATSIGIGDAARSPSERGKAPSRVFSRRPESEQPANPVRVAVKTKTAGPLKRGSSAGEPRNQPQPPKTNSGSLTGRDRPVPNKEQVPPNAQRSVRSAGKAADQKHPSIQDAPRALGSNRDAFLKMRQDVGKPRMRF